MHGQIPHSILLPNQPLFCLSPCVFGCICFVHILTLSQDKLSAKATKCLLGLFSPSKGYRCYFPDINRYFISTNVTFFEDFSFSNAVRPPVLDVLSIPLILPSLDFLSPPADVVTRPLQAYTCRPCPPTRPLFESSSMPQSSLAPIPQPSDDLPIVIRKGTRSTYNPHPVYNFLNFYRLSLPYFVFVSTLSFVSTSKSTSEALSHLSWKQAITEEMDVPMAHGSLSLFLLASHPLVVVRFIQ